VLHNIDNQRFISAVRYDINRALSTNQLPPRNLMLHNIDNQRFISAVRYDINRDLSMKTSPFSIIENHTISVV